MPTGRPPKKAKTKRSSPAEETPTPPRCTAWQWWSADVSSARKPPKDHFDKKIPADIRKEFFRLMATYRDAPERLKGSVHIEHLTKDVWELKVKRHNNAYRLLFMRWGPVAVVLDVFFKNQQKTPTGVALERRATWLRSRGDTPDM